MEINDSTETKLAASAIESNILDIYPVSSFDQGGPAVWKAAYKVNMHVVHTSASRNLGIGLKFLMAKVAICRHITCAI
jgi:hypothetical protein